MKKPKILGKLREFVKGRNAEAKLATILIAAGILALPFVLLLANEASAAVIASEDFEDISDLYQTGTINAVQSTWTVKAGTYSLYLKDTSTTDQIKCYKNITALNETAFTVSVWVYYNATSTDQGIFGLAIDPGTTTDSFAVKIAQANNTLYVVRKESSVTVETKYANASGVISAGAWHNISLIGDNGNWSLYLDGVKCAEGTYTVDDTWGTVVIPSTGEALLADMYLDELYVYDTAVYPGGGGTTATINISISVSPDSDGDGRVSFGSTNQTNVSMDSIDFITITENGNATVTTLTISMQNIGGVIPTYYGGATNCYVYKWVGIGTPTSVDLSSTDWQQVASFDSTYTATITGLSLGQGQSVYLAFRILDNDPENDGIAAGTYESTTTAHSITAS